MANYLDKDGVLYLWGKIKGKFVAKESGKGLSTNDYTTTEKNKLAGIASNANNYSLPTASSTVLGGVKVGTNLSISSGVLSAKDTTYGVATTSANGLMSSSDKTKLNGIASGAEVNQNAFSTVELYQNSTFSNPTKTINAGAKKDKLVLKGDGEVEVYYGGDSGNDIVLGLGLDIATSARRGLMWLGNGLTNNAQTGKVDVACDTALSDTSTNPVQNKVVKSAIDDATSTFEDQITEVSMEARTATEIANEAYNALANYALKTDVVGTYKYKGSVATASVLPTSGLTAGDVYNIVAESSYGPAGSNVAWTGSAWDSLGGIFTITSISNSDLDTICV